MPDAPATPTVRVATEHDLTPLSFTIAAAFSLLGPSQWLIPDPTARREIFPQYFRLYLEHGLAHGTVHTTNNHTAVAIWIPVGPDTPQAIDGYDERLAAITGPWLERFRTFDQALDEHHPEGPRHQHLAILAVDPSYQGRGIGTVLLDHQHRVLDRDGRPAYLEAGARELCALYGRFGYQELGKPIRISDGPELVPMWREPRTG